VKTLKDDASQAHKDSGDLLDAVKGIGHDFIKSGSSVSYEAAGEVDGIPAEIAMVGIVEKLFQPGNREQFPIVPQLGAAVSTEAEHLGARIARLSQDDQEHGASIVELRDDVVELQALSQRVDVLEGELQQLRTSLQDVMAVVEELRKLKQAFDASCPMGNSDDDSISTGTLLDSVQQSAKFFGSNTGPPGDTTGYRALSLLAGGLNPVHATSGQVMFSDSRYVWTDDIGSRVDATINYYY